MHQDTAGSVTHLVQTHLQGLTAADRALVTEWLKAVERRNCQRVTLKSYCGALKAFVGSWDGQRSASLLQAKRSHIESFIEHLKARGLYPSTINTLLGGVQRFYGHLIREEQLEVSPIRSHHYLQEPEPLPRALSDEQVQRFLATLEQVLDRAVFLLLPLGAVRSTGLLCLLLLPEPLCDYVVYIGWKRHPVLDARVEQTHCFIV